MKTIILFGSSRKDGDTKKAIDDVIAGRNVPVIDLLDYDISHYDYGNKNAGDDYIRLTETFAQYDQIILATPVYWYAMSGVMKVFFDRLTDLITIKKEAGRALAGKKVWVISCGTDEELPEGFEVPFKSTCDYFDMHYQSIFYWYAGSQNHLINCRTDDAKKFGNLIFDELG